MIMLLLLAVKSEAAAPSRVFTYETGEIIEPAEVTENEDVIFQYLQAGVEVYKDESITSADIDDGTITTADIGNSQITSPLILNDTIALADMGDDSVDTDEIVTDAVESDEIAASAVGSSELVDVGTITSGAYVNADISVDSDGRLFLASSGVVDLASEVTGDLPVGNLNGGTDAGATTFWRGDGAWITPPQTETYVGHVSGDQSTADDTVDVGFAPDKVYINCHGYHSVSGHLSSSGHSDGTTEGCVYENSLNSIVSADAARPARLVFDTGDAFNVTNITFSGDEVTFDYTHEGTPYTWGCSYTVYSN